MYLSDLFYHENLGIVMWIIIVIFLRDILYKVLRKEVIKIVILS